jgi:hypothetical protein
MTRYSAEDVLLPWQRLQQAHDEIAHRDILSFDLYKRLKHMVLHFYKYAGKIEEAREVGDEASIRKTLVDALIICLASANAMNHSIGKDLDAEAESPTLDALAHVFAKDFGRAALDAQAVKSLVVIGGRMAKAIESSDHMEAGNPRAGMEELVPLMTRAVLGALGHLPPGLDEDVRARLAAVERKSIFVLAPTATR